MGFLGAAPFRVEQGRSETPEPWTVQIGMSLLFTQTHLAPNPPPRIITSAAAFQNTAQSVPAEQAAALLVRLQPPSPPRFLPVPKASRHWPSGLKSPSSGGFLGCRPSRPQGPAVEGLRLEEGGNRGGGGILVLAPHLPNSPQHRLCSTGPSSQQHQRDLFP